MTARPLRTVEEAKEALRASLQALGPENQDNPVAAVRAVATVARRCRLPAPSSWEAFRWVAETEVRPYFERRDLPAAKAATWAVLDPYFGELQDGSAPDEPSRKNPRRTPSRATVSLAKGAR